MDLVNEVKRIERGIVPPCPEGNPLAADLNKFWIDEANKLSPETVRSADHEAPCPTLRRTGGAGIRDQPPLP